jgi:hypothetical protein
VVVIKVVIKVVEILVMVHVPVDVQDLNMHNCCLLFNL